MPQKVDYSKVFTVTKRHNGISPGVVIPGGGWRKMGLGIKRFAGK